MMTATIGLTLATHPLQMLLAVIAIYHAGAEFLGRRSSGHTQRPKQASGLRFRSAA